MLGVHVITRRHFDILYYTYIFFSRKHWEQCNNSAGYPTVRRSLCQIPMTRLSMSTQRTNPGLLNVDLSYELVPLVPLVPLVLLPLPALRAARVVRPALHRLSPGPINQPINQSINHSINQSINQSIQQLTNQSIHSFIHLFSQLIIQSTMQKKNFCISE